MPQPTRPFLATIFLALCHSVAVAQDANLDGLSWAEKKCALYQLAWDWAIQSVEKQDISQTFLAQNDAFVASGCLSEVMVCPRNPAEYEMANLLTIMTMNEGMASTFVPFSCPAQTK